MHTPARQLTRIVRGAAMSRSVRLSGDVPGRPPTRMRRKMDRPSGPVRGGGWKGRVAPMRAHHMPIELLAPVRPKPTSSMVKGLSTPTDFTVPDIGTAGCAHVSVVRLMPTNDTVVRCL
jgi:hypothetical protein